MIEFLVTILGCTLICRFTSHVWQRCKLVRCSTEAELHKTDFQLWDLMLEERIVVSALRCLYQAGSFSVTSLL